MLKEIKQVRQIEGEGFRRWFSDDIYDLFVWYTDKTKKTITGFQLCYDKDKSEHAITWKSNSGYEHNSIDDGERVATEQKTPILVQDGLFEYQRVAIEFKKSADSIDDALTRFVYDKLMHFKQ